MQACLCPVEASARGEQRTSVTTTLAMWAAGSAGGAGSGFGLLLPILLFIPIFYLLLIRPQQKKQKQWQEMLGKIKTGDRVTTTGGIRGVILSLKEDVIIIRVAPDNLKMEVAKTAIASVIQEEAK